MRILTISTVGVGGITDGTTKFPAAPMVAFAGGNGTGKSKLLACLLAPWSGHIPPAHEGQVSRVDVTLELTPTERSALEEFSSAKGWGEAQIPDVVVVSFSGHPTAGIRRHSTPQLTVLDYGLAEADFIRTQPSLNVVYLPAERRLLPSGSDAIDLSQLSELIALQKTAESRNAVQDYGRLDDQEFESFARALCVAASLPNEEGQVTEEIRARAEWESFLATVNALIAPKELLPLTRQNPERLRIRTPSGSVHHVQDLSSGERQALIIISRVLRAGAGNSLAIIDEPDAYLHPHLSQRLVEALEQGVGAAGQLIVATHSPAILDALPPSSIVRMSHDVSPRPVADEGERLELYRSAGFRASALTQADLLVIVEGQNDVPLLRLQFPELARASLQSVGGRARVLREVDQLAPYQLPVIGVVDRDIDAPAPATEVLNRITIWPTGDVEGVYLSDDSVLALMIDKGLVRAEHCAVENLRAILDDLVEAQRENVIAEIAQRRLRSDVDWDWPSPKGTQPIERLRQSVARMTPISSEKSDRAIDDATTTWEHLAVAERWTVVRAKGITNQFANHATHMRSGQALLEALARERPNLCGFDEFKGKLTKALGSDTASANMGSFQSASYRSHG